MFSRETRHIIQRNNYDSPCFALAIPFDFRAFARELFMPDYDMGDGGHVFRTC